MRGKAAFGCYVSKIRRITPAYAGKSEKARNCVIFTGDHPRLCGEKPFPEITPLSGLGITPAYAGKSVLRHKDYQKPWDHPRLCGEKLKNGRETLVLQGSPPPMRGKVRIFTDSCGGQGITPAYAGKSKCDGFREFWIKDHPRLCGEKLRESRH